MRKNSKFELVRPSTRAFIQEARKTPGFSFLDWLHGYIYGRWIYQYIGIAVGEHPVARKLGPIAWRLLKLFQPEPDSAAVDGTSAETDQRQSSKYSTFADSYHGKVMALDSARKLVTVNQEISLVNLERVVPYANARDIVLKNPDHIVVMECPCRASRPNPCTPLDVCMVVGEPFASFVVEHHPTRSRWITPDEAVEILEAERDRGHVHHAFFKDAMLGRFYAICNCCSCCCGAMQAHRNGVPMLASSGFVAEIDQSSCIGCGECVAVCQFNALSVDDNWVAVVDAACCMGCGACSDQCVNEAISLALDPGRGTPLEIEQLMAQVN